MIQVSVYKFRNIYSTIWFWKDTLKSARNQNVPFQLTNQKGPKMIFKTSPFWASLFHIQLQHCLFEPPHFSIVDISFAREHLPIGRVGFHPWLCEEVLKPKKAFKKKAEKFVETGEEEWRRSDGKDMVIGNWKWKIRVE